MFETNEWSLWFWLQHNIILTQFKSKSRHSFELLSSGGFVLVLVFRRCSNSRAQKSWRTWRKCRNGGRWPASHRWSQNGEVVVWRRLWDISAWPPVSLLRKVLLFLSWYLPSHFSQHPWLPHWCSLALLMSETSLLLVGDPFSTEQIWPRHLINVSKLEIPTERWNSLIFCCPLNSWLAKSDFAASNNHLIQRILLDNAVQAIVKNKICKQVQAKPF